MGAHDFGSREATVINALKIVLHTKEIDPEFLQRCLEVATTTAPPGFGNLLEQDEKEFQGLLSHVKGCRSALEIGSRYGKSIQRIAIAMERGSKVVAVDMPYKGGVAEGEPEAEPILRGTIAGIGAEGYEAHLFIGDSHEAGLIKAVQDLGPYDFLFIDGDHTYDGVKADWENFGPHAKIVAFHDIINNVDCFRLWNELKGAYRHVEYTNSTWLGIGILFKEPVIN